MISNGAATVLRTGITVLGWVKDRLFSTRRLT
jgi:hypothetical protein